MNFKLLFVADGRSPIALNWIRHFAAAGYEVHLASTHPCSPDLQLASLTLIPVAFSGAVPVAQTGQAPGGGGRPASVLRRAVPVGLRTAIRQRLGPLTLGRAAGRLAAQIAKIQPDLVHAMRIPYEGMLAALALGPAARPPLLVSVWGNDFTLHAPSTPQMGRLTRLTLGRAAALHADCQRDVRLGRAWGFPPDRPAVVLPGGGGVQVDVFYADDPGSDKPVFVINPRGYRAYVRSDTFFRSVPLVTARRPEVRFLCPSMAGEAQAESWLKALEISGCVELLPRMARAEMAGLFRQAQVAVSPSTHDGTPNTLLEAMACGCFPVAGDLEPLREWITPGINGLLIDPGDPQALAEAVLLALDRPELRAHAREVNLRLIAERAEHGKVMQAAEAFYAALARPN